MPRGPWSLNPEAPGPSPRAASPSAWFSEMLVRTECLTQSWARGGIRQRLPTSLFPLELPGGTGGRAQQDRREGSAGGGWVQPEGPNTLCSHHKVILLKPSLGSGKNFCPAAVVSPTESERVETEVIEQLK